MIQLDARPSTLLIDACRAGEARFINLVLSKISGLSVERTEALEGFAESHQQAKRVGTIRATEAILGHDLGDEIAAFDHLSEPPFRGLQAVLAKPALLALSGLGFPAK